MRNDILSFKEAAEQSRKKIHRTIVLHGADQLTLHGFVQMPKWILRNPDLTPGAKTVYSLLLSYAWQNDFSYPGQDTLAKDMGAGVRSVVRYVQELEKFRPKILEVKRQGQGKPNVYHLFLTVSRGRVVNKSK